MNIYYLIDFENVREMGISTLPPTDHRDHIYVFYTDNASKLSMDAFLGHDGEIKFIKVAAGKQSLDMHLISVLGFLLRDQGEEKRYVIVSRDGGYDNVIRFWKEKGFLVSRDNVNMPAAETPPLQEKSVLSKKNKKNPANRRNNLKKNKQSVSLAENQVKTLEEPVKNQQNEGKETQEEWTVVSETEEKAVKTETAEAKDASQEKAPVKHTEEIVTVSAEKKTETDVMSAEDKLLDEKVSEERNKKENLSENEKALPETEDDAEGSMEKNTVKKKNTGRRNNSRRKKQASNDTETGQSANTKISEDGDVGIRIADIEENVEEKKADEPKIREKELPSLAVEEKVSEEKSADQEKKKEVTESISKEEAQAETTGNRGGADSDAHTAMNNKLMALLREKTDVTTSGAITSIVVRNMDAKNYKQVIYRQMVKKFGQKEGLKNYNLIKKDI